MRGGTSGRGGRRGPPGRHRAVPRDHRGLAGSAEKLSRVVVVVGSSSGISDSRGANI